MWGAEKTLDKPAGTFQIEIDFEYSAEVLDSWPEDWADFQKTAAHNRFRGG
jgi:hypothetical protein